MAQFNDDNSEHIDDRIRLSRDLIEAARTMGPEEARYLVDAYYATQENRKRTDNQVLALEGEPHILISWSSDRNWALEHQIARALDAYTQAHPMGDWMRQIVGIGPVISAGLLAHIHIGEWCAVCHGHGEKDCQRRQAKSNKPKKQADKSSYYRPAWMAVEVEEEEDEPEAPKVKLPPHKYQPIESCPTVGHIWAFAGLAADGQKPWVKKKLRPFNATLKVLCWKAGQSFMKLAEHTDKKGNYDCYYGRIYRQRKEYEIARNERGDMKETADRLKVHFNKRTVSYGWYNRGMLPPAQIDARARRYAVKIFLSHLHAEWYERHYGRPTPAPFPISHLGHAHIIPPPPQAAE
jgi:hypothetical protein